ncbi:MAG: hypothetical protein WCI77_04670 [Candidatus Omnitrophota bacterium]
MPNFYIYLISSLPMLQFGAKPPFSFEKFLQMCEGLIPTSAINLLSQIQTLDIGKYKGDCVGTLKRWHAFEVALRNELVKIRASRKHKDPLKYMRGDSTDGPTLTHIALSAQRNPSPLEAEMVLDRERWQMLEEIATGHYFDLDFLIVYAQKLLILERWEMINRADKIRFLEEALKG